MEQVTGSPNVGQATSARKKRPEDGNERRAVVLRVQGNFFDKVTGADPGIVGRPGGVGYAIQRPVQFNANFPQGK